MPVVNRKKRGKQKQKNRRAIGKPQNILTDSGPP